MSDPYLLNILVRAERLIASGRVHDAHILIQQTIAANQGETP